MYILTNLPLFILFIGVLVFVHELGHFLFAKLFGVKVLRFSLGFGPRLLGYKYGETDYCLSALPLGGYVKMFGENVGEQDIDPAELPKTFLAKPVWQRALILLAGPFFNFLLAICLYFSLFVGMQTFNDTRVGTVNIGEPAWQAGLRPGDKILKVGKQAVTTWDELVESVGEEAALAREQGIRLIFERDGATHEAWAKPQLMAELNVFKEKEMRGKIGVSPYFVRPTLAVIDPRSPAALAGLQTGDRLVKVEDVAVDTWAAAKALIKKTAPHNALNLEVEREGKPFKVTLHPTKHFPESLPLDLWSSADTNFAYTGLVSKETVIAKIDPGSPAAEAGLAVGDRLLKVVVKDHSGQEILSKDIQVWSIDLYPLQNISPDDQLILTIQRERATLVKSLHLKAQTEKDELKNPYTVLVFGAHNDRSLLSSYTLQKKVGWLESSKQASLQVYEDSSLIMFGLQKIVQGKIGMNNVGGPIMLFVIAEKTAKRGLTQFLRVMAMISVNLGLLNLFPIPVLDGGHLLFCGLEVLWRRPISLKVQEIANIVGIGLLLTLMILAFRNDILRYIFN